MSPEWIVWGKEGLIFIFSIITFFIYGAESKMSDKKKKEKRRTGKWHFLFAVCHRINKWFAERETT